LIAFPSEDLNTLTVFKANERKMLYKQAFDSKISSLAFNLNGGVLAIGFENGTLVIMNAKSGKFVSHEKHHEGQINSVCFKGATSTLFSVGEDYIVNSFEAGKKTSVFNLSKDLKGKRTQLESPTILSLQN
jgi:WD40 repeat protein